VTRLTDEELAELERMEKAATPGFWNRRDIGDSIIECEDDTLLCTFPSEQGNEDSNAKFVALSRNALPSLLAEVRELRAAAREVVRLSDEDAHRFFMNEAVDVLRNALRGGK
jgi:hypothetical protein